VIEDTINLRGITFRFIDTAGIRQTTDVVESIGIERTFQKMSQADIILWIIDADNSELITHNSKLKTEVLPYCEGKNLIVLFNKCDKITPERRSEMARTFEEVDAPKLFLSAKNRMGLDELETLLVETAALPEISQNDVIVTNIRHYEALVRALESIHRVQDGLLMNLSGDFVSQDLRECLSHLAEIVGGAFDVEDVLGNIFKNFCIGK
jgi:tRNA modification GTPase